MENVDNFIFCLKWGDFPLVLLIVNIVINIFDDKKEFTNRIIAIWKNKLQNYVEKNRKNIKNIV